mmetsp:Transcript_4944/g.10168  ORF Transcript_4944/g.10168 Transcript_4944/m.10168 type:complete len:142 (-) Transcript_4944:1104-1529(-)
MENHLRTDHRGGGRHEAEFGIGQAAQFRGGDSGEVGGAVSRWGRERVVQAEFSEGEVRGVGRGGSAVVREERVREGCGGGFVAEHDGGGGGGGEGEEGEEAAVQDLVVQCDDDEVVEEFGGDGRCGCGEVAVDEGGGEAGW